MRMRREASVTESRPRPHHLDGADFAQSPAHLTPEPEERGERLSRAIAGSSSVRSSSGVNGSTGKARDQAFIDGIPHRKHDGIVVVASASHPVILPPGGAGRVRADCKKDIDVETNQFSRLVTEARTVTYPPGGTNETFVPSA